MADNFYPKVDIEFINEHVRQSEKVEEGGILKSGSTTVYVAKGVQAIYKRITSVRELEPGGICLEQATAIALRYGFLGKLIHWLEENKDWKEGAYIEKDNKRG